MKEKVAKKLVQALKECSSDLDKVGGFLNEIEDEEERNNLQKSLIDLQVNKVHKFIEYINYQFPLLSPWKTFPKEGKEKMEAVGFDLNSPWHENAYHFFGFMCNNCKTKITSDEVNVGKMNDGPLEFCVVITSEAQKRGWQHSGEYTFLCPKCV